MRTRITTLLTVFGAVSVLLLAGNTVALAATGKGFLLGKTNKAGQVTTLSRTSAGPVLKLTSKRPAGAPLVVNGKGKVANLNADKLDGLDSTALRSSTYLWTRAVDGVTNVVEVVVPLPSGTYVIGYDAQLIGAGVTGEQVGCAFTRTRPDFSSNLYAELRIMSKSGYRASLSATGVVTISPGDKLEFFCGAVGNFVTDESSPIQIHATRTNVVGGKAL